MPSPDLTLGQERCGDVSLPVNPFLSNRYHFGMLLGVADLETEQGYHRGKSWLHNAWLHGSGVIWGLDVTVRADHNEVVVAPGLAIDAHGRELWVADSMCVDLGAWYAERRPDDLEVEQLDDGDLKFTVHVELCHDSCFDRPVPSISEPCEEASFDTAYSRAVERGLPRLVVPRPDPAEAYPRLRQFFGQVAATDQLVADAQAAVDAAAAGDRAVTVLTWFRRLAAADATELAPEEGAPSWSPLAGDGCVPLAEIRARLRPDGDRFVVVATTVDVEGTMVDTSIRPAHVRTRTIQELLCPCTDTSTPSEVRGQGDGGRAGRAGAPAGPGAVRDGPQGPSSPGAPREVPTSVHLRAVANSAMIDGATVSLKFTAPPAPSTIAAEAFAVSVLRADGWHPSTIRRTELDDDGVTAHLVLSGAPRSRPIRVVARGTGPAPIVSSAGIVLSGVEGDPFVPSGSDAALMITYGPPEED
jgi:hypothetical protein